jgi:hypothetical protein
MLEALNKLMSLKNPIVKALDEDKHVFTSTVCILNKPPS